MFVRPHRFEVAQVLLYCILIVCRMNGAENSSLLRKDFKVKSPLCGIFVSEEDKDFRSHHNHPFKMSPPSTYTWRDRALRDIYFEKR